jgi:CxxC-x17-CxxC domain-containing protein
MRDFKKQGGRFANKGADRRDRDFSKKRTEMFKTTCDECGRDCSVPFKPTGNKKVYCSDCFERQGGRDGSDNRSRRDSSYQDKRYNNDERVEYSAICDECGSKCTLPFKPTSSKPVYCSSCFENKGGKGSDHKIDNSKEIRELKDQIVSINNKLDKIMKALEVKPEKVRTPKVIKVSKEEYISATEDDVKPVEVKKAKVTKKTSKKVSKKTSKKE